MDGVTARPRDPAEERSVPCASVFGTSVIISIGKNVGRKPMSDSRWTMFKSAVTVAARRIGDIVFAGDGDGVYDGDEDSFTVIASVAHFDLVSALSEFAEMAPVFGQEVIALTVGTTFFVRGAEGQGQVALPDDGLAA